MSANAIPLFVRCLLRLYPKTFRESHGQEMRQMYRDRIAEHGKLSYASVLRDLMWSIPKAHYHELFFERRLVTAGGMIDAGVAVGKVSVIGIGMLFVARLIGFSLIEAYIPFAPYLDTNFASGFTWEKYRTVHVGMTQSEVSHLLGGPLSSFDEQYGNGGLLEGAEDDRAAAHCENCGGIFIQGPCWEYSQDGAFKYWDLAWVGVNVCFDDNGLVRSKHQLVHHD